MLERYLVVLLVKLGVVASAASILARSNAVKRMLLREQRTVSQQLQLALWFAAIFATGIATRVITRPAYQAVDLGLEGCLLAGVLGGYVTGIVCGILVSIPAVLNGEGLTMPMLAIAGVLGGLVRDCAPDGED
ncbi:MAG: sensor histidine kinase, partial [Bryobacteraceae bacterium]|nr:sensor histidine kinase [Bryobacteraceae bacterium]